MIEIGFLVTGEPLPTKALVQAVSRRIRHPAGSALPQVQPAWPGARGGVSELRPLRLVKVQLTISSDFAPPAAYSDRNGLGVGDRPARSDLFAAVISTYAA